jgi:hypothetical protein
MVARGSGFKFGRGTEHSDGMMQFDGEARFRADRAKRNLGALAREGFQPARRHPSAARSRYHQRAYTDDELDDEPCVIQFSACCSSLQVRLLLLTVVAAILVSSSTELPHESPAPDAFAREAYVTLVTTPSYAIGAETLAKVFLLLFMPCIAYVSGRLYRSALLQIITIAGDSV